MFRSALVLLAFAVVVLPAAASSPGRNGALLLSAGLEPPGECGGLPGPPSFAPVAHDADVSCDQNDTGAAGVFLAGPGRKLIRWRLRPGYFPGTFIGRRGRVVLRGPDRSLRVARLGATGMIRLRWRGDNPAGSADGRWVAFERGAVYGPTGPPGGVWVAPVGAGKARFVGDGVNPRWSTSGRLAFDGTRSDSRGWYRTGVMITSGDAREPQRLMVLGAGETMSVMDWSPSGKELLVVRTWADERDEEKSRSALFAVRSDGRGVRRLTSYDVGSDASFTSSALWSPDGRRIAFVRSNRAGGTTVYTASARPGAPQGFRMWRRMLRDVGSVADWQSMR